jgi:enoyl-CoA hydratase/carnithine racemase
MELLLTGDPIDAERALALGLVNAVVQPGELQDKVFELGNRIASQAPLAVAAIKRAMHMGIDVPIHDALDAERGEFMHVFDTEDAREGVTAFLEKRRPTWQGRARAEHPGQQPCRDVPAGGVHVVAVRLALAQA